MMSGGRHAKDNVALPLIYTLSRVSQILIENKLKDDITLLAAGGLRTSVDFIKALALGADAVYSAGAMKIAMGGVYCRACHTGKCPTGIYTQNRVLREMRFDIEKNTKQVVDFFNSSTNEMKEISRMVGKDKISDLNKMDLFSLNPLAAQITGVRFE
jgi:methylamine---glutamate N-methyltransferase subunit C